MATHRRLAIASPVFALLVGVPLWPAPMPQNDGIWKHTGIGGGGHANRIAFDPNDSELLYVGTDVTGLFKSTDRGATWAASRKGMSEDYVRSIAVHPDSGAVFVGTGAAISRWTDGADEWENVKEIQLGSNWATWGTVEIDPIDPDVVWAGIGTFRFSDVATPGGDLGLNHVWRSEDAGDTNTWVELPEICNFGDTCVEGLYRGNKGLFFSIAASAVYASVTGWQASSFSKLIDLGAGADAFFNGPTSLPDSFSVGLKLATEDFAAADSIRLSSGPNAGFNQLLVTYDVGGGVVQTALPAGTLKGVARHRNEALGYVSESHTPTTDPVIIRYLDTGNDFFIDRAFLEFDTSSIPDGATVLDVTLAVAVESGASSPTTSVEVKAVPHDVSEFGDSPGVHSIVLDPLDFDPAHPGADRAFVSTTVGVFQAIWDSETGQWYWFDQNDGLPHNDCRDLQATYANGTIQYLYLVLDTEWDGSDPYSVGDYDSGFGGGVYVSGTLGPPGANWFPVSQGLDLFDGTRDAMTGLPDGPKNIRLIEINPNNGTVYAALTWRSMYNEGVWRSSNPAAGVLWERMTESRCYAPFTPNVDHDHFTSLGKIDGLRVDPVTNDIYFTTSGAFRCPGGDCMPGSGPNWEPLHTDITEVQPYPCDDDLYSSNGMEITFAVHMLADPLQHTTWFVSYLDQGPARSDDSGATWVPLYSNATFVPLAGETVAISESKNALGLFPNPDPGGTAEEWVGIYVARGTPDIAKLYMSLGKPSPTSTWYQQDLDIAQVKTIHDVLYVDGANMLVSTNAGVYRGTRAAGTIPDETLRWSFSLDERDLPSTVSRHATDILAEAGTAHDRTVWIALRVETSAEGGRDGGVILGQALGTSWTVATGPAPEFSNVLSLARGIADAALYAGNGSTRGGNGAVLKSLDGGASWTLASQLFSCTGDPADAYAPANFDVVGLAVVNLPVGIGGPGSNTFDRIFAAVAARGEPNPSPSYQRDIWGGVFASDNAAASFQVRSAGLDAGHSSFLRAEPLLPFTLFYGTLGNGAYVMEEVIPKGTGGRRPRSMAE